MKKATFDSEAGLCRAFISQIPKNWTAYPETAGFDILLVRAEDGAQIGVEAKMSLNAKVILQASDSYHHSMQGTGPDFRCCLVPYGTAGTEMVSLARLLMLTVIEMKSKEIYQAKRFRDFGYGGKVYVDPDVKKFEPPLPAIGGYQWRDDWVDHCPVKRCRLPDYVPDVCAGASGPSQLSEWKIKAIKICIIMEKRGWCCIADFIAIGIHRQRFLQMGWVKPSEGADAARGKYVSGKYPLDLRSAHPVNYLQIEADYAKWAPKEPDLSLTTGKLL